MPFNGTGVFTRLYSWATDAANGIKIRADRMDAEMNGFATGLTNCITRDGQSVPTADIPWGGRALSNVGNFGAFDAAITTLSVSGQSTVGNIQVQGRVSGRPAVNIASGSSALIIGVESGFALVTGVIAGHEFREILVFQTGGVKNRITDSIVEFGSPPTRTYTDDAGSTRLALAGGTAGTYTVNVVIFG